MVPAAGRTATAVATAGCPPRASSSGNVMAGPGAPDVETLASVGVRRVSVGSAVGQAAYTVARRAAAELLSKGTYGRLEDADDFGVLNGLFNR